MVEWGNKFSARVSSLKASAIRELLSLVNDPEIISLAGGMPDPSLFPKEIIADISKEVFLNNASKALQYGATEGVPPLRESLLKMTREEAVKEVELENIIVTTASQQGLSLLAEIFINPGDSVIVEAPSYVGGLQAFHAFQANFTTIPLDDEGIKVDILEEKLKELKANNINVKFIYVIPNFQNPAGVTMSLERRKKLLEISHFYGIPIIEDDPYGDIRFKGEKIPSLLELDKIGIVIELRTFSKILAPGLRLGWIVADKEVTKKVSLAKQAADLCSPSSTQYIVDKFIRDGHLNNYLEIVRKNYKIKLDSMLGALEKYFPEETTWTEPQGGMFVWAEVPEYVDTDQLFREALQEKVAYVIGSAFYPYGEDKHHMRLNFSLNTPEKIEEGIKRLGNLLKKKIH
ncbi:MAG: aminotransferase [Caldisericum sp. CG2_30_36_11]|nr:MAG: aminotransferase [Caldisericum sp. CG2_30_36_11]